MLALPIPTVLYQTLLLLFVIAVERWFFLEWLNLEPHDSWFYARVANLASTITGWLLFFIGVPLLPTEAVQEQVRRFVLTGQALPQPGPVPIFGTADLASWVILAMLLAFFATVFIEAGTLQALDWFLRRESFKTLLPTSDSGDPLPAGPTAVFPELARRLLVINGVSYSSMLLLLLVSLLLRGAL